MCDYVRARHHRSPLRSKVRRLGLHPPFSVVRINNNLLICSSVSYPSRNRVDSFSSTLRRRREMGELDRKVQNWLYATGNCSAKPAAAIAARKLGPTVAVACDPTIDCRMREQRGTLHGAWKKSYRTEPRCGSFCAKITPVANGMIEVDAQNTWGLASGTRFPALFGPNRANPSVEGMVMGDAPFAYPSSILNDAQSGWMKNLTIHYRWRERSPCCGQQ